VAGNITLHLKGDGLTEAEVTIEANVGLLGISIFLKDKGLGVSR